MFSLASFFTAETTVWAKPPFNLEPPSLLLLFLPLKLGLIHGTKLENK